MPKKIPVIDGKKRCTGCGRNLPVEDFHWKRKDRGERQSRCGACMKAYLDSHRSQPENAQKKRDTDWLYHNRHREARNAERRLRAAAVPERVRRDKQLRRWFQIGIDQYEKLLAEQGGVCAICKQAETMERNGKLVPLAVDHEHGTDRVRGLLCHRCNVAIGMFADDPERLQSAIDYLKEN